MTNRLCSNCGTALPDDAVFCTNCGTPVKRDDVSHVEDDARNVAPQSTEQPSAQTAPAPSPTQVGAQPAPTQAMPQGFAQPAPTQATAQPFAQPTPTQATQQSFAQPAPTQSSLMQDNRRLILVLAVIVVVALIVIIFSMTRCSGSNNAGVPAATVSDASSSSSSSSSSSAVPVNETLSPEKQKALDIYEKMGALDGRISACATEFNENCLKPDRALRERCAQTAQEVYQDAIGIQTTISAMSTGGARELGEDTGHLRELDNDLVNRIQVIYESWKRSLEFADPAPHESYIVAPIVADNEGGTNKYYKHFKENYPNWNPIGS